MKVWAIIVGVLLWSSLSYAQVELQKPKDKIIDKEFIGVGAYLVAMSIFDIESTFAAVHNGAHEANPIMKPFVRNGRAATYAFTLGLDAGFMFLAYELKGCKNKDLRKTWWVVPMVAGTSHGIAGGLNLRYVW